MVIPGQAISIDDLDGLAILATAKLSPVTPYTFNAFAGKDKIGMPSDIKVTVTYGSGSFADSSKVTVYLYGYKTILGVKTYTYFPTVKAFQGKAGSGNFSLQWDWVSVTGATSPDGYILMVPAATTGSYWIKQWKDISNTNSFFCNGDFTDPSWTLDTSLVSNTGNLPCGNGIWLKTLNTIHTDLCAKLDIFGGSVPFNDSLKVSGPWCISTAPKCYLTMNGKNAYKNLKFLYSEADSVNGNQISSEADLGGFFAPANGANNLTFDAGGELNGEMVIFSTPAGQSSSDWNVTVPSGVTYEFNPTYVHPSILGLTGTAFVFTIANLGFSSGVPQTITVTPLHGGSVYNPGNPSGKGAWWNTAVFTASKAAQITTDTQIIHPSGIAGKQVALANSLTDLGFTDPANNAFSYPNHYRVYCNGVFTAQTLPSLGIMTYLDVDLPQYSPNGSIYGSSRRTPIDATLPYVASVDNRGALWPVFRDTEFTPDSAFGQPLNGSIAWQGSIGTKYVVTNSYTDAIPPYEPDENLYLYTMFSQAGDSAVRFVATNPAVSIYVKANTPPTLSSYDATQPGRSWVDLPAPAGTTLWYIGIYNPTNASQTNTLTTVLIEDDAAPNGTFFHTGISDDGQVYGALEGYSYNFPTPSVRVFRPTPLYGYCVYALNVRRAPVDNGSGVSVAPNGDADLSVSVGLMAGFGWSTAGTFQLLQSITIPKGKAEITVPVFWPVCGGAPLAYQCSESVVIRAEVNFQPMMHSLFDEATVPVNSNPTVAGFYCGQPWYQTDRALLFFYNNLTDNPILLPVAATIYNDLETLLNLLP